MIELLLATILLAPAVSLALLGLPALLELTVSELRIRIVVRAASMVSFVGCLALCVGLWNGVTDPRVVSHGEWFPGFELRWLVDGLAATFALLTALLMGVVASFSYRYMHREPGFRRFFLLLALFQLGLVATCFGGTLELVFAAWEFAGLSSALLIAFFHERLAPVQNGLRTFVMYRVGDLGLLAAVVLVHIWVGHGEIDKLLQPGVLSDGQAQILMALLLWAAMGKSAQLPFSGWLPRAMEGPTPSSAICYGALSVHAGAFLLLRFGPLLERAPLVAAATAVVGVLTALHATMAARVQTDIKSRLAHGSLTQVSVILVEVGCGLRLIPLLHIVGHACARTLQFLRAPSLLHDIHETDAMPRLGAQPRAQGALRLWFYRFALERSYADAFLDRFVVEPLLGALRRCDAWQHRFSGSAAAAGRARVATSPLVLATWSLTLLGVAWVLPVVPSMLCSLAELLALVAAVYAAGLAIVQSGARAALAAVVLSQASVILAGLCGREVEGLHGAMLWWPVCGAAFLGLGRVLTGLEARRGALSLRRYAGGFDRTPLLAATFLLLSLVVVGFPGTAGFAGEELLVSATFHRAPFRGSAMMFVSMLSSIALLRMYFRLFTGTQLPAAASHALRPRERVVFLGLLLLLLGGGLAPGPMLRLLSRVVMPPHE